MVRWDQKHSNEYKDQDKMILFNKQLHDSQKFFINVDFIKAAEAVRQGTRAFNLTWIRGDRAVIIVVLSSCTSCLPLGECMNSEMREVFGPQHRGQTEEKELCSKNPY